MLNNNNETMVKLKMFGLLLLLGTILYFSTGCEAPLHVTNKWNEASIVTPFPEDTIRLKVDDVLVDIVYKEREGKQYIPQEELHKLNINYDISTKDRNISMWRAGNQSETWHMMSLDNANVFRYSKDTKDSITIDRIPFEERGVYYIPIDEVVRIVGYNIDWDYDNKVYILSENENI
jgi:hypothetical protein